MSNPILKSKEKLDQIGVTLKGLFSETEIKRKNEKELGWIPDRRLYHLRLS
jgi:hypothetical protein